MREALTHRKKEEKVVKLRKILAIIGIVFAAVGLVCIALCIFRQENQMLLSFGLACSAMAAVLSCIINFQRLRGKREE